MSITPYKPTFFAKVKDIITKARQNAYFAINTALVEAYWLIGKRIVEEEQHGEKRASYGEGIIKALAKELSSDFGKGFSVANLKNFRHFYLVFPYAEKSYASVAF